MATIMAERLRTPEEFARKMLQALDVLREVDPTLPTQMASVFLLVASLPPDTETRDLPARVGMSQSAFNRAITYLGDRDWKDPKKPGLDLVETRVSLMDRRQRIVRLTAKGRRVVARMKELLDG